MCVSGSLIRSSTWRSSSVSAPCISSSICLPSSADRSRTMRGSFCQALPIGCMRVFITPSCSSAVTFDRRCSGTLNSESSCRRTISSSWLRVSTSSETIVIRCSSVSTLTRIDWLATLSASAAGASVRPRISSPPAWRQASRPAARRVPARRLRPAPARFQAPSRGTRAPDRRARPRPDAARARASAATSVPSAPASCGGYRRLFALQHHALEFVDQVAVAAFGLRFVLLELAENFLEAVDRRQDQRDRFAGHRPCRRGICPSAFRRRAPALRGAAGRGSRRCP